MPAAWALCLLLAGCGPPGQAQLTDTPLPDDPTLPSPVTGLPPIGELIATIMPVEPTRTPAGPPSPTALPPTLRPTATPDLPVDAGACLQEIEQRELREPYNGGAGERELTLSGEEYAEYLELMGIESLCIPAGFGAPFLNADWNGFADPVNVIGRMASIGFERLNDGLTGWSRGYLLYSTYDFEVGTMYQDFAEPEDLAAVRQGRVDDPIQVDGVDGFIRYVPGFRMGGQDIAKTYVFPFDDYYVAAVLVIGVYSYDEVEQLLPQMQAGTHPDLQHPYVGLMEQLVRSIEFR